jgi:hypothetical protein
MIDDTGRCQEIAKRISLCQLEKMNQNQQASNLKYCWLKTCENPMIQDPRCMVCRSP